MGQTIKRIVYKVLLIVASNLITNLFVFILLNILIKRVLTLTPTIHRDRSYIHPNFS